MSADESKPKPTIKARENGSLRVDGLDNLIDAQGNPITTEGHGKGNIALCCCGHSKHKPFCDRTHKKTDVRRARLTEEPWIDGNAAAPERAAEQARLYLSGASSHSLDGAEHRDQDRPPTIKVTAAGPYLVTGGIELLSSQWGEGASREHYALCRCGHSKNKPFCDGTHGYVEFDDPGLDTTFFEAIPDPENRMEIPEKDYQRIDKAIHSDQSPVGIDARKTHVMILYKLEQIEAQLQRLADEIGTR